MLRADIPLDQLRIESPCDVPWDGMQGDDRVRLCGQCELKVYNIRAMTNAEARELIRSTEGRVCAQLYRRPDGTVITRECPLGRRMRRGAARAVWAIGGVAAASIAGMVALAGRNPAPVRMAALAPFKACATRLSPDAPPPNFEEMYDK